MAKTPKEINGLSIILRTTIGERDGVMGMGDVMNNVDWQFIFVS